MFLGALAAHHLLELKTKQDLLEAGAPSPDSHIAFRISTSSPLLDPGVLQGRRLVASLTDFGGV